MMEQAQLKNSKCASDEISQSMTTKLSKRKDKKLTSDDRKKILTLPSNTPLRGRNNYDVESALMNLISHHKLELNATVIEVCCHNT